MHLDFCRWKSMKHEFCGHAKSNINSTIPEVHWWCGASFLSKDLLPWWIVLSVQHGWHVFVKARAFCYGRNLPPLQSSPCHGILSSGQRAKAWTRDVKGEASTQADCQTRRLRKKKRWKKGANYQLNTQSQQPKRTPIRSQRCNVYFSSPTSS